MNPARFPVLVVDRQHDPVPEVIDERSAGTDTGQPGGLDRIVVVAAAAEVARQRGPSARGVSDVPLPYRCGGDAALSEVGGYPAAGELADVELFGVQQDVLDPGVTFGGRGGRNGGCGQRGRFGSGRCGQAGGSWLAGRGPGGG